MRIGIDLGGSKIEGIALAPDGSAAAALRVPTPQHDYLATIAAVAQVVAALEAETATSASVGIGAPGSASRRLDVGGNRLWQGANATWINDRAFEADLAAALARPVRVANDANCFTVSEAADGAGAGASVVFGVIIGTGVGGGLVVDGRPVTGRHGIAGEWGHVPLPWARADEFPGEPNFCGHRGTIETWVAGKALERDFVRRGGLVMRATDIADAAGAGDDRAAAVFDDYVERLARGLAMVVNIVDPDCIVLGGGASRIAALYDRLPARIAAYAFTNAFDTPVVPGRHGDASGVRGAAQLWP